MNLIVLLLTCLLKPDWKVSCVQNSKFLNKTVTYYKERIRYGFKFNAYEEVIFRLYTKEVSKGQVIIINDVDSLRKSNFDPKRPTRYK